MNPSTLVHLVQARVAASPDKTAFTFLNESLDEEATLTYADLDLHARRIARRLLDGGHGGECVLLLYPTSAEFITAFFGCLYAGAVAVPVYPPRANRSVDRIKAIATSARARAALTTADVLSSIARRFTLPPELDVLAWIATSHHDSPGDDPGALPAIEPEHLAYLQYTSGSTGAPKGVMITHANLLCTLEDIHRNALHDEGTVMVTWLPVFHDLGLIYGLLQPIYNDFPCYVMAPLVFLKTPVNWILALARYEATHTAAPNFGYDICARHVDPSEVAGLDLSHWRAAIICAEPVRKPTVDAFTRRFGPIGFRENAFCPCFGLAEATLKVTATTANAPVVFAAMDPAALAANRALPVADPDGETRYFANCGRTHIDAKVLVVEPETLTPCNENEIGEIWTASGNVAQGYWENEEATAYTFGGMLASGDGPFMRTGDLGFLRDGDLYVAGRLKDLIIIRGRNHYPQDIEWTTENAHPDLVAGAGVAFSVDEEDRERLVVLQEIKRTALRHLIVEDVVGAIRKAVALEHELEVHAVGLLKPGRLLKTSSGKLQRNACKKQYLADALDTVALDIVDEPPPGPSIPLHPTADDGALTDNPADVESFLVREAAELLRQPVDSIDVHDTILNIGLDSLSSMKLVSRLETHFSVDIPVGDLLEVESIARFSELITAKRLASWPASGPRGTYPTVIPLRTSGALPPLFCFTAGYGDALALSELSRALGPEQPFYLMQPPMIDGTPVHGALPDLVAHYLQHIHDLLGDRPCRLAGYSAGGLVSYEVASQMHRGGASVDHLFLLDPPFRHSGFAQAGYRLLRRIATGFPIDWRRMSSTPIRMFFALFADDGLAHNLRLVTNYIPQPYAGRTTLFQGRTSYYAWRGTASRWRDICSGPFAVRLTYGDHDSFLRGPYGTALAKSIQEACVRADDSRAGLGPPRQEPGQGDARQRRRTTASSSPCE